ncbi:MAG: hypothetical protein COV46_01450 [Deltaproteobacteria bacterium CG11_big_fil_rev_8_21_14_0_20_49_13]|nr:MAG: hypothetical protein COV46_01450 [Deltaproteobacteria bacterium CG11_big_fil_rev_8_21_14_0_20_49_13]
MSDRKLLEILVCPQCKGSLVSVEGGAALACKVCQLKYSVRDGIPVMLIDEASGLKGGSKPAGLGSTSGSTANVATFNVVAGPNKGLSFHLERSTCKVLGRAINDPNKTAMFNVDVSLSLDEGTKGLIQHYVSRQFKDPKDTSNETGSFKRTSDVILDDVSISRLHAMLFFGESGVGILDLVSKNGTYVNGEEVESRLLKRGDAVEFGETKVVFEG